MIAVTVPFLNWTSGSVGAHNATPGAVATHNAAAPQRLEITKGGSAGRPMIYFGGGRPVGGIDIDADYVIVDGYTMNRPEAPGIEIHGNNVVVMNNVVTAPQGDDGDGLRFFGNNLEILHNTISRTDNSTGAHADCMQTFATDEDDVASRHVLIDGNRCEHVDNMCLMAEGPNSEAGDGSGVGVSDDWIFSNNYCQTLQASQTLMVDDVQHLTVIGNTWAAGPDHAVGLQNHTTDAHILGNHLDRGAIRCEVGIDDSSRKGYVGPAPRCEP